MNFQGCAAKKIDIFLISVVYRLILLLSRDSASKLVRLYCSNMFMKLEKYPECRFFDIRKDCLTIESLSLLLR